MKLLLAVFTTLSVFSSLGRSSNLEEWAKTLEQKSLELMFQNISPPGSPSGLVVASPSRIDPEYYYHWVRDSALVMDVIVTLYERETDSKKKQEFFDLLMDFANLSRAIQLTPNLSGGPGDGGDGEPKFNPDGSPYMKDWGRPQNDGPASRAVTLTRFALKLIKEGKWDAARKLYDGKSPSESVIMVDVEYTLRHWQNTSVDLWEEVRGHHFYTRFVQRKALIDGARLADLLGDGTNADIYRKGAAALDIEIKKHLPSDAKYILATLDEAPNKKGKIGNLDVAAILAVLYNDATEESETLLGIDHEMVLATAATLIRQFKKEYKINSIEYDHFGEKMQVALGRYLGDQYYGGNHWFLVTAAFAELCHRNAIKIQQKKRVEITALNKDFYELIVDNLHINVGDAITENDVRFQQMVSGLYEGGERFLRRIRYHAKDDFEFHEQSHRDTGFQLSAENLTWNCAAHLRLLDARTAASSTVSAH